MRREGHRGWSAAALAGPPADAIDDLHVAAMQAVEIPERQYGLVPPGGWVVGKVNDVHLNR
jgi:hypothetical protein